jgi:hypothetical protein
VLLALMAAGCTQGSQANSPTTAMNVLERAVQAYHQADGHHDNDEQVQG